MDDDRYIKVSAMDLHDESGNVLNMRSLNGISQSYIWGYNSSYPIVKVDNANYSELEAIISSTDLSLLNKGYTEVNTEKTLLPDEEVRNMLGDLRIGLPNALVTTYTYDPLVGMTSQTDPSGVTTFYEYDDLNRLMRIRDQDNNILEQYDYHYAE